MLLLSQPVHSCILHRQIPENITFEQAASIPLALTTDVTGLYNQSPAPQNLGLRYKPVWEPEGATAYVNTPAFIVGGASSLGQYGKFLFHR